MSDEIDTTTEVWKTILEAPHYAISNLGRVRRQIRCKTYLPRILKLYMSWKGFASVMLYKAGTGVGK